MNGHFDVATQPKVFDFHLSNYSGRQDGNTFIEMWCSSIFIGWMVFTDGCWKISKEHYLGHLGLRPATDEEIAALTAFLLAQA